MKQSEIGQALDKLQNKYSFEAQIISILNGSNLKYRGHIGLAKFTKDIAIGFAKFARKRSIDLSVAEEQLFNEYLNTL